MPIIRPIKPPRTWRERRIVLTKMMQHRDTRNYFLKRIVISSLIITGVSLSFIEGVRLLSPGGGAEALRQQWWTSVSHSMADESMKKQEKEGWLSEAFTTVAKNSEGGSPKFQRLDDRARAMGEEKYKTWEDVMSKGFPQNAAEFDRVSRMRPETMDEMESYTRVRKGDYESYEERKMREESETSQSSGSSSILATFEETFGFKATELRPPIEKK